jgi:hypothetical protein
MMISRDERSMHIRMISVECISYLDWLARVFVGVVEKGG